MKHESVGLFAQPLVKVNIDVTGVAKLFYEKIRGNAETINTTISKDQLGLHHFHNDENVFEIYPELKTLEQKILSAANYTYEHILNHNSTLRFTNVWFNECEVGSQQFMHNHCNSVISGTLYLKTDENTIIQFRSPFTNSEFVPSIFDYPDQERPNVHDYVFHHDIVTVKVSNGDCLFWGSHLKHGYPPNKTPGRLSLSFNLMPTTFNCTYKI